MFFFCDVHLCESGTGLLGCESLEVSPISLALVVFSYSTSISLWGGLHGSWNQRHSDERTLSLCK